MIKVALFMFLNSKAVHFDIGIFALPQVQRPIELHSIISFLYTELCGTIWYPARKLVGAKGHLHSTHAATGWHRVSLLARFKLF